MQVIENKKISVLINAAIWDQYMARASNDAAVARSRVLSDAMEKLRITRCPVKIDVLRGKLTKMPSPFAVERVHGSVHSPGYTIFHTSKPSQFCRQYFISEFEDSNGIGRFNGLRVTLKTENIS